MARPLKAAQMATGLYSRSRPSCLSRRVCQPWQWASFAFLSADRDLSRNTEATGGYCAPNFAGSPAAIFVYYVGSSFEISMAAWTAEVINSALK